MRNYFIILLSLVAILPLSAQDVWDLEKCIVYAIENSVEIQQSDYAIQNAQVDIKQSKAQRYPNLSAGTNASWNTGRTVDPTTNDFISTTFFSNGIQLNSGVTLFNGGRIKKTIEQAGLNEKASQENKSSMINTITLNVLSAYFDALFARDNLKNAEVQLKTINDQIAQMNKMVAAGSRAQFEVYDLEAQAAQQEQQVTLTQNSIDLALIRLKGVMNIPISTEMELANPPADQAVYSNLDINSFEEILENVIASRPELRAFDLNVEGAEVGVEIAEASLLPSINFGVGFNTNFSNQFKQASEEGTLVRAESAVFLNGNPATLGTERFVPNSVSTVPWGSQIDDNKSLGFGFSANIPIYSNYNTKASIDRAKINVLNQRAEREKYAISLRNTLGQLITDVKAAGRNLESTDKVLKARQIAFDNAEKRFGVGAINSFDYTNIQDQLNRAKTDQIIAKYDYMLKAKVLDFYQGFPVSLK